MREKLYQYLAVNNGTLGVDEIILSFLAGDPYHALYSIAAALLVLSHSIIFT